MKWYRNLGISGKILLLFLVILLLVGSVAAFGVVSWTSSNAQNKVLFDNYGNAQGYLGQVYAQYQQQRALLRDMLISKDAKVAENISGLVEASDALMLDNLELFRKACIDSESQALYEDLNKNVQAFRGVRDELAAAAVAGDFDNVAVWIQADSDAHNALIQGSAGEQAVAVSEATTDGEMADAVSEATTDGEQTDTVSESTAPADAVSSATVSSGTTSAINNALSFMVTHANDLIDAQVGKVNETILLLIIGIGVAAAVAIVLGLLTSHSISKPLKKMSEAAMKMAEGNTDIKGLDYQAKNEVGRMMDSFRTMTASVKAMVADVDTLLNAALEGRFSARADENKHQGDYRVIIKGINDMLNAVISPINEAKNVLHELSEGNLNAEMSGNYRGDYTIIKDALNDTIATLHGYIEEISYVLGELARGNLTCAIQTDYRGDFVALKDSINGIIGSLNEIMGEISKAARHVASGTQQVSGGSQEISEGAINQAGSIQELTATMTVIAAQTKLNADNANGAFKLSSAMHDGAQTGRTKMQEVQKAMEDINESSVSISKIIKVIDDIAFQTNILALNAAVEAARAGAQGKGFGVVAEEVRNLAARSAGAAKETAELIEGSASKTEAGNKIANDAMKAFERIVADVDKSVKLVEEIADASNQQSASIEQVSLGISSMSTVVQNNSAFAEETAAAAQELSGQAEILHGMVAQFKLREGNDALPSHDTDNSRMIALSEDNYKY